MECLNSFKIQEYIDGSLNSVENAMVRDHLILCESCRKTHQEYEKMEKFLLNPVEITPPPAIEYNVLKTLFPRIPTYSSIFTLIAASFLLLVTWIYIYFDFANNSIVKAFQLTSSNTSSWIGSIIKFISSTFSVTYTIFKVLNRALHIMFDINICVDMIGFIIFIMFSLMFYSVYKVAFNKFKHLKN